MNKASGLILSEVVTLLLAVIVTIAVGFGIYVSHERNKMVERAEASLAAVKKRAAIASESGELITCDDSLVEADVLANDFLSLSIRPILIDESKPAEGFGAGVYVHSKQKTDGNDTFVTAERLYEALKEKDAKVLRELKKEDEEIEYSILLSESESCINWEQATTLRYLIAPPVA